MKRRPALAAVSALLLLLPGAAVQSGTAVAAVAPAKLISRDFPDPDVVKSGSTWYAYATNGGLAHLPVASASAVNGPWTTRGDAMPGGPSSSWARAGRTWAPDVHRNADGTFTLTYTAWHASSGRQCIGVATASSPLGPFNPVGGPPLICQLNLGGSIDANTFVDTDGTRYLLWKNDGNAIGQPSTLWLARTANNGTSLASSPVALITSSGIIEAPDMVRRASRYVLFFSSGSYTGCGYETTYATATGLGGPWTRAYRPLITTQTLDNAVCGPGGADAVTSADGLAGGDRMFFHGWVGDSRHLYNADLGWANDLPVVRGSRVRYEAEHGTLNHCVVRTGAAGASGGAVAAYIDYADSWVDRTVYAPTAGSYSLHVRFANGSPATASHGVSVNGTSVGSISYPVTGWDRWTESSRLVNLNAGWNTIRLSKGAWYAEIDFLEIA
jgi:arabinan endo-1,5-alpha-L-arabinosidase